MLKKLSQSMRHGGRRIGVVAAGVVMALGLTAAAAVAVTTFHSANRFVQFQARTGDTAWTGAGTAWTDVPGATTVFGVPSGQTRTFHTTFTAESQCLGSGWCSVRVVVRNNLTGAVTEFKPLVGTDFAFDSAGSDAWESHAVNRTSVLMGPGSYTVKVQAARVAGATFFRLDDWNFAVNALA